MDCDLAMEEFSTYCAVSVNEFAKKRENVSAYERDRPTDRQTGLDTYAWDHLLGRTKKVADYMICI